MAEQPQSLPNNTGDRTMRKLTYVSLVVGLLAGIFIWQQRPMWKAKKSNPPAPGIRQDMMSGMIPGSAGRPTNGIVPGTYGSGLIGGGTPISGGRYIQFGSPGSSGVSPGVSSGRNSSMGFLPMAPRPSGGRLGGQLQRIPQPVSRFFANLATQAGPFTVSVRQVMDPEVNLNLYSNRPITLPRPTLYNCAVSLQIMTRDADALQRVSEFATHLVYVDDRNRRHESRDSGPVQPFENGLARIVSIKRASPESRYLKYIEGQIALKPADDASAANAVEKITFRIENIPLPVENHLYGVAAAAYLPSGMATAAKLSGTVTELRGTKIRAVDSLFPPFTPEPNPLGVPNRLIILSDAPNRFLIHLPDSGRALRCTLKTTLRPDGEIATAWQIEPASGGAPPLQRQVTLWDNEPLVLLCSERALFPNEPGNRTLALRLHLYTQLPLEWIPATSPFPASKGEHGGTIIGDIRVGEEPVRFGTARLELERTDGGVHSHKGAVQIETLLDGEGRFCVANSSPGLYRVRVIEVTPYRSDVVALSAPRDYLCRRYGLREPILPNALQDKVQVRSGAEARLAPFVITEGARIARTGEP